MKRFVVDGLPNLLVLDLEAIEGLAEDPWAADIAARRALNSRGLDGNVTTTGSKCRVAFADPNVKPEIVQAVQDDIQRAVSEAFVRRVDRLMLESSDKYREQFPGVRRGSRRWS